MEIELEMSNQRILFEHCTTAVGVERNNITAYFKGQSLC